MAARAASFSAWSFTAKVLVNWPRTSSIASMYSSIWYATHGSSGYNAVPSTVTLRAR